MDSVINRYTKGLVSIVTPCYNTSKFISSLFDSILKQTYPYVEMFAINDGSTDNTLEILYSYIPRFENKGYKLTIIDQQNSGQSVAINKGLKLVNGEFLVWPDSDDFYYTDNAIERMVMSLKNNPDAGMIRTQEYLVDEETLTIIGINGRNNRPQEPNSIFEDCLFVKNGFYFPPGAYMVRTIIAKDETNMEIYTEKKAGQNWQLLLPILYNHKCISICEPLYCVRCRNASHSRGQFQRYEDKIDVIESYENTIVNTLKRIKRLSPDLCDQYIQRIKSKYLRERYLTALVYRKQNDAIEYRNSLINIENYDYYLKLLNTFSKIYPINRYISIFCRIYKRMKKV